MCNPLPYRLNDLTPRELPILGPDSTQVERACGLTVLRKLYTQEGYCWVPGDVNGSLTPRGIDIGKKGTRKGIGSGFRGGEPPRGVLTGPEQPAPPWALRPLCVRLWAFAALGRGI